MSQVVAILPTPQGMCSGPGLSAAVLQLPACSFSSCQCSSRLHGPVLPLTRPLRSPGSPMKAEAAMAGCGHPRGT